VFSIFSRKGKPPRRGASGARASGAPATQPAADTIEARREAARRTAEKIDRIESEMIADGPKPSTSVLPVSVPETRSFAVVAPPSQVLTETMQGTTSMALGDPSNAMAVDINASSLPGVLEEAAILYANGQSPAALQALRQALADADLGGYQQLGWLMLLDLYQLMSDRSAFEALALDYAARFESSPPTWSETAEDSDPRLVAGAVVALSDQLDDTVGPRLELIERGIDRRRETIIDCATLKGVDAFGAARLMALVDRVGKGEGRNVLVVRRAQQLFDVARAAIEPGRRDDSDACWMLALFALRLLGEQAAFEDLSIEYCMAYEVSPPSWEPLPPRLRAESAVRAASADKSDGQQGVPAEPNAFVLAGEATGRATAEIRALREFSAGRSDVVIDCRNLRRIEFVAIGELLNEIVNLRAAGKQVLLAEPNRLVLALMLVMGMQELAEIRKRKI